ncbi:hypothetical protein L6R52_35315 [Myxococcota bacterium]|nr:hypothetical protein [Myxococcota bacterium]
MSAEAETPPASRPFPSSLCHRCVHVRYVETKRSTFVLCTGIAGQKYPPQPVVACLGFAVEREAPREE